MADLDENVTNNRGFRQFSTYRLAMIYFVHFATKEGPFGDKIT